jgi:hypothetical protein
MIYTRLAGGLGNQIFQLAAAMALRTEGDQRLLFDTGSLAQYAVKRDLELPRFFDIPKWFVTDVDAGWEGRVLSGAMRFRIGRFVPKFGVNDGNFAAHLLARQEGRLPGLMLLDGYFQRDWLWLMFDAVRRELAARLRDPADSYGPAAKFDCLLHIRGGDFLTAEYSNVVDREFYVRSLEFLRERADIASAFVVTDDVPFAKQALAGVAERVPGLRLHIPEQRGDMFDDFMNIRNARSRVIGNSTFSWWAAALDPQQAITVSPQQWTRGLDRNLVLPWEIVLDV